MLWSNLGQFCEETALPLDGLMGKETQQMQNPWVANWGRTKAWVGKAGYKIAYFIVHMWIKFPLKMFWNAHVPITPRWYRRELWGHVFGCSHPCVCWGLPDCLGAAFVPALILCQWGLAGSWHPDTFPSIRWHRVERGIKNDPIKGLQCVLTGTTCSGVFRRASFCLVFLFFYSHLFAVHLTTGLSLFLCVFLSHPVTTPETWAALRVLTSFLYIYSQPFLVNISTRCKCSHSVGLVLTKNTVIRGLCDRNIIHRVGLSVFIATNDKSLVLVLFLLCLFLTAAFHLLWVFCLPSVWSCLSVGISPGVSARLRRSLTTQSVFCRLAEAHAILKKYICF